MRGTALIYILISLVALEAVDSYRNEMFWPSQVVARWGKPGIGFFAHAGMWSDLLILPILFAYLVDNFGSEWTGRQMLLMGFIGVLVAGGNHLLLMFTQDIPDPIGWKKQWFTVTILLHFLYMGLLVAIVGLFYFCSKANFTAIVLVSVALGIHMMAGTHVFTGMLQRIVHLRDCPDFLASSVLPFLAIGIWAALAALAWYAGGVRAALMVVIVALALGTCYQLIMFRLPLKPI